MDLRTRFRVFKIFSSRLLAGLDLPLVTGVLLMGRLSALNLYGIGGADHTLFQRQLVLLALGMGVMVVGSLVNYRLLKDRSAPVVILYVIGLVLVLSTLWFESIRNIRAWIVIAGFQFEPSELMKFAIVIVLAKYFSQRHVHIRQFSLIAASGVYCAVPAMVILAQPDLGSAAIIGIVWLVMLVAAGINRKHLFLIITAGIIAGFLAWIWALAPYQKDRILAFIDPYQDPTGYGYHIIQSKVAIGSGGFWGRGLGEGSQATLGFLPEPYNDFAFAAFVEQFGLVGASVVIGLLLFIVWRILAIGRRSGNNFARLVCVGVAAVIFAHTFISGGVNSGLLPITGIPMTLLSYGGSHLLSTMAALGLVQSIKRYG